jgi:hypothetical protein
MLSDIRAHLRIKVAEDSSLLACDSVSSSSSSQHFQGDLGLLDTEDEGITDSLTQHHIPEDWNVLLCNVDSNLRQKQQNSNHSSPEIVTISFKASNRLLHWNSSCKYNSLWLTAASGNISLPSFGNRLCLHPQDSEIWLWTQTHYPEDRDGATLQNVSGFKLPDMAVSSRELQSILLSQKL